MSKLVLVLLGGCVIKSLGESMFWLIEKSKSEREVGLTRTRSGTNSVRYYHCDDWLLQYNGLSLFSNECYPWRSTKLTHQMISVS